MGTEGWLESARDRGPVDGAGLPAARRAGEAGVVAVAVVGSVAGRGPPSEGVTGQAAVAGDGVVSAAEDRVTGAVHVSAGWGVRSRTEVVAGVSAEGRGAAKGRLMEPQPAGEG